MLSIIIKRLVKFIKLLLVNNRTSKKPDDLLLLELKSFLEVMSRLCWCSSSTNLLCAALVFYAGVLHLQTLLAK